MTNYTYEDFTAYYGGTSPKQLREYADTEMNTERKEMFLRLARELESGVVYLPQPSSELSYRKGDKDNVNLR